MSGHPDNFMEEGGQNTASITRIKLCPKPIKQCLLGKLRGSQAPEVVRTKSVCEDEMCADPLQERTQRRRNDRAGQRHSQLDPPRGNVIELSLDGIV